MALTELQCSNFKALGKDYTKPDKDGLSLLIRAKGTKSWLCEFVSQGLRIKYNYGKYPDISLAAARRLHVVARELAAFGRLPAEVLDNKEAARLVAEGGSLSEAEKYIRDNTSELAKRERMTFAEAAGRYKVEWVDRRWKDPEKGFYPARVHLIPALGAFALDDVSATIMRGLLIDIRGRVGEQAALHTLGWARRIYDYAMEHEWCVTNPARAIKAERVGNKSKRERWLKTQEIRRYLAHLYQVDCYRGYKLALHLLLMLALRKNELCGAAWSEFDLSAAEWTIPAKRMKTKKEHVVFLPSQAVEMFQDLQRMGGGSPWVLPMLTNPKRAMNGNRLNGAHLAALLSADIEDYNIHDHRHTASTHLRNQGFSPEVIETALSHAIGGMAGTYSHADYKAQRLSMLQSWADFLDTTMNENVVLSATFRKVA